MHFLHALGEMPKFSLYLKGHLKHKKKLDDVSRVVLNEECFMVLHKSCPPKIGEPGSFFIPCQVGDLDFQNALADLGTSINVMSLYVADKLFLPPLTPTMMSIQFVDGSIKYTKGTVDNVFVQVKGFVISVDFVVLDVEDQDSNVSLVFGKPFLNL